MACRQLPLDAVSSWWLAEHWQCVTALNIHYHRDTAPLLQQLPLSTAPLVGLARLEVY
jgi:hypothetical protein